MFVYERFFDKLTSNPPVSTPFLPGSEKKGEASHFFCFISAENRAASSLWVVGHRYSEISVRVKTLMGLERFEVRFFFEKKST